jgi:hypothetical protein
MVMVVRRMLMVGGLLLWGTVVGAEEYSMRSPTEMVSAPVHLTEPVGGRVEVTNLPEVQSVQIVGGISDQPVEVQGEVGLRLDGPLQVEVVNAPPIPAARGIEGPIEVVADQPLRVWVDNPAPPPPAAPPVMYSAYVFRSAFEAKQTVLSRTFRPGEGEVFLLTDLTLDTRPDSLLWVRVLARPDALAGNVTGGGDEELAVLVLDPHSGPSVRPATPVPLRGSFSIQVEAMGPGQGAPFRVLAAGTLQAAVAADRP